MAVYFDHLCQSPAPGHVSKIQWHCTFPFLAVASNNESTGGVVNLFNEENLVDPESSLKTTQEKEMMGVCKGEHIPEAVLQRNCPASAICWHPTRKLLAVGWESGELVIWNEQDHELHNVGHPHHADVSQLQWSSAGSRLLSADSDGIVIVWKVDSKGRAQQSPLCQHNLQESITQVLLRPPPPADSALDISALARAAVSGDEAALDLFSWSKGSKKSTNTILTNSEAITFFIGGANGEVFYLNESGKCSQVFRTDGSIRKLLYFGEKNILVTITSSLMLSQHTVSLDGDTREILKVKLSGKSMAADITWAGKGLLATATGESVIRMWDLDREENFVLNLEGHSGYDSTELITCVAYCPGKGMLAGGTASCHVALWKFSPAPGGHKQEPEERWKLQPPSSLPAAVNQLTWGSSKHLLGVSCLEQVYILSEQVLCAAYCEQIAVVQTSPTQLSVDVFTTGSRIDLTAEMQIKGVCCTKENIGIWNGRKFVSYEISPDHSVIRATGTFSTESPVVCMYEQNAYTFEPGKVQVRTFQGTVKQLLNFTELDGEPACMEVCAQYLVVGTSHGMIKLFDLSRREAKQVGNAKNVGEAIHGFTGIVSAKCNCNGSKVSIIVNQNNNQTDPKLYIWDVEMDTLQFFNFETGRGEQDDYLPQTADSDDATDAERGRNQAARDIAGRYPVNHFWDPSEVKFLVVQALVIPNAESKQDKPAHSSSTLLSTTSKSPVQELDKTMVVSVFITPENGILLQDSFCMDVTHSSLMGLEVPYFYFINKSEEKNSETQGEVSYNGTSSTGHKMVTRKVLRDFVGLENADKNAREAMMNFSYYLTIGNMDEAFKAIKLIKSESVWENMAKMGVKTRRLDVAAVCLGNMGHARGAKALRESAKEPELDARVAMLAIQLGLHDEAERLLKNCNRYDLLNEFYQSCGQWGKAMETAEMYDRVHLRTTYYNYAKHLEAKGDINGAIPNFEKSETHRFEVPRMLFDEPQALEGYIMKTKDKALRKWWAQYMESTGEMETALQFYEAAQDFLSLVRVYCYCENLDKAAEICNDTGDRAACYHLARQYEANEHVREAIHFFTRAQAYGNAIRLCKENSMEDQMMNLALLGKSEDMMEAARYYEARAGQQDKAVMLYHKAANFSRALDLAFESKQFAALQLISEDLDDKTDPQLLQRCADFFIENGQYDRAVDLLANGKQYWEAIRLIAEQHVPLSEELVGKLTPPKAEAENDVEERNKIMEGLGEVCMQQRHYHSATKLYTQAGNRAKAFKALLKSGDTEKIIFYAGISRNKEIYVMAANYLQSLDWRKDPEIMKNIIGFYTKGRALDSLAGFYDACSQVEIDEYQNYDKALGALSEAYKCMTKAKMKNQSLQEEKLANLRNRIGLIKKFVQARRAYEENTDDSIKQCQVLLQEPDIASGVRIGDIYGFIIEHYANREKWKAAYAAMEDMKTKIATSNLAYYVNLRTIEVIHQALNIPLPRGIGSEKVNGLPNSPEEEDGEEVDEEVAEVYDD